MTIEDRSAAEATVDSRVATELYEKLRAWTLDRSREPAGSLSGLAVLVRGGLRCFLQTCTNATEPVPQPQKAATGVSRPLSSSPQAQLAALLAGIFLSRSLGGAL